MARKDPTPKAETPSASRTRGAAAVESKPAVKTEPSHEAIALRAYEIHVSGEGASDIDDWLRAERELLESA